MSGKNDNPNFPGKGLGGWLGRQVGYVVRAARSKPASPTAAERKPLWQRQQTEEAPMPGRPGLTLRRTVTDEVIEAPERHDA